MSIFFSTTAVYAQTPTPHDQADLANFLDHRTQRPFKANIAHQLTFFISLLAATFFLALDLSADTLADQIDYGIPTFFSLILTLPIISTTLTLPLS